MNETLQAITNALVWTYTCVIVFNVVTMAYAKFKITKAIKVLKKQMEDDRAYLNAPKGITCKCSKCGFTSKLDFKLYMCPKCLGTMEAVDGQ